MACLSAHNFENPRWIDGAPFPLAVADTGQLALTAMGAQTSSIVDLSSFEHELTVCIVHSFAFFTSCTDQCFSFHECLQAGLITTRRNFDHLDIRVRKIEKPTHCNRIGAIFSSLGTWHIIGVYSPDKSSCSACGIAINILTFLWIAGTFRNFTVLLLVQAQINSLKLDMKVRYYICEILQYSLEHQVY